MASPSRLPSRRPAASGAKSRPISMFEVPTDHLKKLQQIGDGGSNGSDLLSVESGTTSKQSKRRSLLPTFSRKASPEDEKETVGTIREDTSDSEVSARREVKDDRKAMPPPPKPTTRPTSMRPPGATAPARTTSLHARTTSKDTNVTTRAAATAQTTASSVPKVDSGIKRTGSTRLPQSPRIGGPGATPTQQTIPARGSSARATTSTTAQKRASTVVSKPPAINTSGHSQAQSQPSPSSPTGSATSRPSTRGHAPSLSKPTFSTYQQHYSPAKSALPKPGIPSSKTAKPTAPAIGESEIPITLDVALEQVELLQLSLLHRNSDQVLAEYEASAKQTLGKRHLRLQKDYNALRAHEQEQRRLTNLTAIETWCPDQALLAEHLQTLNRVVSDLRSHTERGSRYSDLTQSFDTWAMKAETTLFDNQQAATFIEALPESWRATHTSLALKLRSIQRDLDTMPPAPPSSPSDSTSSLETIMDNCSSLVDSMLKELEVMTKLQKEVLQRGKARIDEQINALVSANSASQTAEKENWVPAWTSVT